MPIYEYKCSKCGETFEVIQTFSEGPLGVHPGCGGNVARVFSPPGIIFKGSGFHVTDYRKDSSPAEKTESKSSEKKSEKKSEMKSDTKKAEK